MENIKKSKTLRLIALFMFLFFIEPLAVKYIGAVPVLIIGAMSLLAIIVYMFTRKD